MREKLIPVSSVLDALADAARPRVRSEAVPLRRARGLVLAAEVRSPVAVPMAARALRRGHAVRSGDTLDASVMTPALLPAVPPFVAADEPLPPDTDAVLPTHAILVSEGGAETTATVAPLDGVRRAGEDALAGMLLLPAGTVLTGVRIATLLALGIDQVEVRRPRIALDRTAGIASGEVVEQLVGACGGVLTTASDPDSAIVVLDRAEAEGGLYAIALRPGLGEARFSASADAPPRLILPARTEAAIAVVIAVLMPLIDRLSRRCDPRPSATLPLAAKLSVPAGVTNVVGLVRKDAAWQVTGAGDLPLGLLAQSHGLAVLGPECEGLPPGARLEAVLLSDI